MKMVMFVLENVSENFNWASNKVFLFFFNAMKGLFYILGDPSVG
jgi:hypothetical protein